VFERHDWELFRTLDGLCAKAGVPRDKIASLVAKELMDNALDESESCEVGLLDDNAGFFVQDNGPGLDHTQVADLFSIKRPLKSTKLLRLPTRGALGNGLRVVASAVLATGGTLKVYSRGQVMNLIPCFNGTTTVELIGNYDGEGTRVEVQLGPDAGSINYNTLMWARGAKVFSGGQYYKGKSSPWWYTSRDFHELCLAAKDMTVRDLVSEFENCSNGKIGTITSGFKAKQASNVTLDEAKILLERMKSGSKPVKASRLGCCNTEALEDDLGYYASVTGTFELGSKSNTEIAAIPYVVEAWTTFDEQAEIHVYVNRTPITSEVAATHSKTDLRLSGCNLSDEPYVYPIDIGRRPARVFLSIITPYMPITTSGKSPNLRYFRDGITDAIKKSVKKAKRNTSKISTRSQKEIVWDHLDEGMKKAGGGHRYSQRQLFYSIRPFLIAELGKEPNFGTFTNIITEIEDEIGQDLPGMYRDDRGAIYHPHKRDAISLGTRMVEVYQPPDWTFNKVLYIEKEGFFQILQDEKWPERHDCALLTAKGQATRAAKDLIDRLGDTKEEITFYSIHDADAAGTMIYQALQNETKARPARKVEVINLGLEPHEGILMGLEPEKIVRKEGDERPVADYVPYEWAKWLQNNRIELNAMTTPQFLDWLDKKMEIFGQGRLIPPEAILAKELHEKARQELAQEITNRILKEQDAEGQIDRAFEELKPVIDEKAKTLAEDVAEDLTKKQDQSWRDPVMKLAHNLMSNRGQNCTKRHAEKNGPKPDESPGTEI